MKRLIVTALSTIALSLAASADSFINVSNVSVDINVANGYTINSGIVNANNIDIENSSIGDSFTVSSPHVVTNVSGCDIITNVNANTNGSSDSTGVNTHISDLIGSLSPENIAKIQEASQKSESLKESYSGLTSEQVAAADSQLKTEAQAAIDDAISKIAPALSDMKSAIENAKGDVVALLQSACDEVKSQNK